MKSNSKRWYTNIGLYALCFVFLIVVILRLSDSIETSWPVILGWFCIPVAAIAIFLACVVFTYYGNPKFINTEYGQFRDFDVVYYTESDYPYKVGILNWDIFEGWFIRYDDGTTCLVKNFNCLHKY